MSVSVEKKKISDILDLIKTGFETGDFSAFFSSFTLDENNSDVNENCFFSPEKDKYYEDNICTEWTEREFEHDGGEMIDTYSDASDWDEDSSYYKGYEAVYEWHFYYFW